MAGGGQYVSWIHDRDVVRAVELLLDRDDLDGPVNLVAPEPLPQRDLMRALRRAWGHPHRDAGHGPDGRDRRLGAPHRHRAAPEEPAVVPGRLLAAGFEFEHPQWPAAAEDLVRRVRTR